MMPESSLAKSESAFFDITYYVLGYVTDHEPQCETGDISSSCLWGYSVEPGPELEKIHIHVHSHP